jgi:protein TonB
MKIYATSRRQDLLFGSLGTTLLLCSAAWVSSPQKLQAAPKPADTTPLIDVVTVPPPDEETPPPEEDLVRRTPEVVDIPVHQDEFTRIARPDEITQAPEDIIHQVSHDSRIAVSVTYSSPGRTVWDAKSLDQVPSATFQARSHYPEDLRRQGIEGEVLVDFIVDTAGNVRNATAIRSSNREFEESAVAAVSRWKFKAGRKEGLPVFTHMVAPIEFKLDGR